MERLPPFKPNSPPEQPKHRESSPKREAMLAAVLIAAAAEQGCAERLRFVLTSTSFHEQINLNQEQTNRLVPQEVKGESLTVERGRLLHVLEDMGVQNLEHSVERPVQYADLTSGVLLTGGEFDIRHNRIEMVLPSDYLFQRVDQRTRLRLHHDALMTYRHETLHTIALDLRHTAEEREGYATTGTETNDPLAVGSDLHEGITAFFTNVTSAAEGQPDRTFLSGQALFLLCAEGLRRHGDEAPLAHMAQVYFNGGREGWRALVEQSGQTLVADRLIPNAHALHVAIDRLPTPEDLAQGADNALSHRLERFQHETGYQVRQIPTDTQAVLAQVPVLQHVLQPTHPSR